MVRKLKSFKSLEKGQFTKRREVMIDENFGIPIKSLSPIEIINLESELETVKPPIKTRKSTAEEKAQFEKDNPNTNKALLRELKVQYYDYTDEEYLEKSKEANTKSWLLQNLKYVDMRRKIDEETGEEFWQNAGLKSEKDYTGLIAFLFDEVEGLGLGEEFLQSLLLNVKGLKSDNINEKLADLDNLFKGVSTFDIIELLTKIGKDVKKTLQIESESEADANDEGDN